MNLAIIGNKTDDIAVDIWKNNTNYTVVNESPYLWNNAFMSFIKDKDVIVSTTPFQFTYHTINETVEQLKKLKFIPIFIADNKKDIVCNMYTALEEFIPETVLFTRNKKNKDYNELIKICKNYLYGKGMIEDDNIIQASGEGEGTTSEE